MPNFGHWYSRGRVALGAFDYDRRGILDETHLRFFTRRSLLRAVRASGIEVLDLRYTGLPFDVLSHGKSLPNRIARRVDRFLLKLRPTLFGYQFGAAGEAPPCRSGDRSPLVTAGAHPTLGPLGLTRAACRDSGRRHAGS